MLLDSTGNAAVHVLANYPTITLGDACKDLVLYQGACIGAIQNLVYRAAFAQYAPPMIGAPGSDGKWTMISMPLKYIYSADFQPDPTWGANAFTDIKSYMSYFDLAYSDSSTPNPDGVTGTAFGSFSKPFANIKQILPAGFGFASNVISTNGGGTTFDSIFYFPRFTPYGNAKYYQDLATRLFEVQYKYHYNDNGEWINSYPSNPAYNPFTLARGTVTNKITDVAWSAYYNNTEISYLDTQDAIYNTDPLPNPLLGQDSRYRFIYEEIDGTGQSGFNYDYNTSTGEFTLPISGSGTTRIVGNPFMSHLDFDIFSSLNSAVIQPYYRLWDGTSFYSYTATGFTGTGIWDGMDGLSTVPDATSAAYRYIPPMQAFFVDVQNGVLDNELTLNFNTEMSTAIPNNDAGIPLINELRARSNRNENLLKLRLKMNEIETVALLASLPNASDHYILGEDIYKLFSYDKATPEIYTVSDKTAIEINAVSQEGEQKLIPLGIKTNQTGQFEISIEGATNFNAYEQIFLRDALEDKNYDLREISSFTFDKTSLENLEGRFYILLGSEEETTETTTILNNQEISIVWENGAIRVYSPIAAIESFEVHDVSGRLLFKDTKIGASTYLWNPRLEQGIYLLNVRAGKADKVQKIKW